MDPNVQKALNDKLYDKRKSGALEYVSPPYFPYLYVIQKLFA